MDAVEFLKEQHRMCEALNSHCEECGLSYINNKTEHLCGDFIKRHPEEAAAIVEKWAKDHPRKTRQNELLKLFPRVSMTADDVIAFCPESMDSAFVCPIKERDSYDPECGECRKKYWLEEVEDDDQSNDQNRRKRQTRT